MATLLRERALLLTLLVCIGSVTIAAQDTADQTCLDLMREARNTIAWNPARATELMEQAIAQCELAQQVNIRDREALRWQIAQLNLQQAESAVNRLQQYELADLAVRYWTEYSDWYGALSDEQRAQLAGYHDRIQQAVRFLGNSVVARGEHPTDSARHPGLRELFSRYAGVPVRYVSADVLTHWKEWLWRCPDWNPSASRSYRRVQTLYCGDEGHACEEEWISYRERLARWIDVRGAWIDAGLPYDSARDATRETLDRLRRELAQIDGALACGGDQ